MKKSDGHSLGAFLCLASVALVSVCHAQFNVPPLVNQKCGVCHLTPSPFEMAKDGWPVTIEAMLPFMVEHKVPLTEPEYRSIIDYYVSKSPEKLYQLPDNLEDSLISFKTRAIGELEVHERPEITSVKFADIDGDGRAAELIVTDSLNQSISSLIYDGSTWRETLLAEGLVPVNTTPMDIDGDGDTDYGICHLGELHPVDDLIGAFHLLINDGKGQFTRKVVIPGDVPRITDCAPGDYDGDGDIDIVLAMFGWRTTGAFRLLEQTAPLEFTMREIMTVNGAMRVIPAHLNDDDRIDFLALVSQQHESIVRFINEGDLKFRNELIIRSSPTF